VFNKSALYTTLLLDLKAGFHLLLMACGQTVVTPVQRTANCSYYLQGTSAYFLQPFGYQPLALGLQAFA
jgi:hypothetical protein